LARADAPGFRLQPGERALGNADRKPALGLHGLEAVPLDPAGLERARRAFLERPDDLEQAIQLEQRVAGLGLELTPEPERLLGQAHVLPFGVCKPEDPRATATRATVGPDAVQLVGAHCQ